MLEKVDPQVHVLIEELGKSRTRLEGYVVDLEKMQKDASAVFPKKIDARSMHYLDDKLKVVSSFYQTILSVRQEINKLLISEIDIRRKVTKDGDVKGAEVNIRQLVDKLDKQGYALSILEKEAEELGLDELNLEITNE